MHVLPLYHIPIFMATARRLVSARITTTPTPVISGDSFHIMCSVILAEFGTTSPGSAEIQWIAPDQTILPISNDTRKVSTSFNTSTLTFSSALTSQTGEYICRANFSNVINTDRYQLDVISKSQKYTPNLLQ